jgi:uncharacterized protein (DUF302 family)
VIEEGWRFVMASSLVVADVQSDFATTVQRLTSALSQRGIKLFATIDHAAAAREVGLNLADEVVLIFGNPAGGTPLMQQDPRVGIELPLRLLVWSRDGTTKVAYNDPVQLADHYALGSAAGGLQRLRDLLGALVAEVAH